MEKEIKPKKYTHIDYEALLVYVMKKNISIEQAIQELGLNISRTTVVRNLSKMRKENPENEILKIYDTKYKPSRQNIEKLSLVKVQIKGLEEKQVIKKNPYEDVYRKLTYMKEIIDSCNGNLTKAARVISSGNTILGNVKISRQGLTKNMKHYEEIKKQYEEVEAKENSYDGKEVE